MSNEATQVETQETEGLPPIEALYKQVRDHGLILRGMAVHLGDLQKQIDEAQQAFDQVVNWLEAASAENQKEVVK